MCFLDIAAIERHKPMEVAIGIVVAPISIPSVTFKKVELV